MAFPASTRQTKDREGQGRVKGEVRKRVGRDEYDRVKGQSWTEWEGETWRERLTMTGGGDGKVR